MTLFGPLSRPTKNRASIAPRSRGMSSRERPTRHAGALRADHAAQSVRHRDRRARPQHRRVARPAEPAAYARLRVRQIGEARLMQWILKHPKMTPEGLGAIPYFLDEDDPRPAREQFHERYNHGGGWRPMPNFT